MKATVFQFQNQFAGLLEEVRKLLAKCKNSYSLDLEVILNYMLKKLKEEMSRFRRNIVYPTFDTHKIEPIEEFEKAKYNDPENMV